jgi:hypothetical protein
MVNQHRAVALLALQLAFPQQQDVNELAREFRGQFGHTRATRVPATAVLTAST